MRLAWCSGVYCTRSRCIAPRSPLMNKPSDRRGAVDDTMRPIEIGELPLLPSAASSPRSRVSTSSRGPAAATPAWPEHPDCPMCQGWGQLLEDEARAVAEGLLLLDRHLTFDGRRLALVACDCAAGQQLITAWQHL